MTKLYKNWVVHNIVAHPIMQMFSMVGLNSLAVLVHDATLPKVER